MTTNPCGACSSLSLAVDPSEVPIGTAKTLYLEGSFGEPIPGCGCSEELKFYKEGTYIGSCSCDSVGQICTGFSSCKGSCHESWCGGYYYFTAPNTLGTVKFKVEVADTPSCYATKTIKICVPEGGSCSSDNDCCQNLYCYKGTCRAYCQTNSQCDPGDCCTHEGSSNTGNSGPDESQGRCVSGVYSNKWLCDPPTWKVNREETKKTTAFKLFETIKTILKTTLGITI
nr:hypothetical protein [Candidatus Baldrarchaeota archaeon]